MKGYISRDDLWRVMVQHKLGQDLLEEYLPPEGIPGQGGADAYTELKGFKRDYDANILDPVIARFDAGGDRHEIADYLTQLADRQQSRSAGNYLRASLVELREMLAPDYVPPSRGASMGAANAAPNANDPAGPAISALRGKYSDIDAQETLDDLQRRLPQGATVQQAQRELAALERRYGDDDDQYRAETASMLKTAITRIAPVVTTAPAVKPPSFG